MNGEATTGPIMTAPSQAATERASADGFNLVACALSLGALTLTVTTTVVLVSIAVALAVTTLALSILGVSTGRRHPWAGYVGIGASALATLLGVLALTP